MTIDYDRFMRHRIPDAVQELTERDTMLYALGLGLGADPMDRAELAYVYEQDLQALPTMPVVLASPGAWIRHPDLGVDYLRVVHGEQALELHAPVPARGRLLGQSRVVEVVDKGEGRGALVFSARDIIDTATDTLIATVSGTTFCRGNGGFGGPKVDLAAPHALPDRAPDVTVSHQSAPNTALIYRLSGDYNPLHADPAVAAKAGFPRPILHGLATYGIAGYALVRGACGGDPARLRSVSGRFTAPVYPGETFETDLWLDGKMASFRTRPRGRDVVAISNGLAVLA